MRFHTCEHPPCDSGLLTCHESGQQVKCMDPTHERGERLDAHGNTDTHDDSVDKSEHEHAAAVSNGWSLAK